MRAYHFCTLGLLTLTLAAPALAGNPVKSIATDFKRINCWPKPFTAPDRHAVRAPFVTMVENGWRRQNLLGDYHFTQQGELTESGQLKIRWILFECAPQHRSVFVHTAMSPEQTQVRLAAVSRYVQRLAPPDQMPSITATSISDQGWPAAQADAIGRAYDKSTPVPRLPAPTRDSEGEQQ